MKKAKAILFIGSLCMLLSFENKTENTSIYIEKINFKSRDTLIDFQDELADKIPTGFKSESNCNQTSNWVVLHTESGNRLLAQQFKNTSDCFNMLVLNKFLYTNFTLTAKINAVAGDIDQGGGLMWRYIDNKNYYLARYNPLENNLRLYKVEKGIRKQLQSADCAVKTGMWCTFHIVMNQNHIECWLNGEKLIDTSDDTFKKAGQIGLWTKSDAQTQFDELVLLSIKK